MAVRITDPQEMGMEEAVNNYRKNDLVSALEAESNGKSIEAKLEEVKIEYVKKYRNAHDDRFLRSLDSKLTDENRVHIKKIHNRADAIMNLHSLKDPGDVGAALPALSSRALDALITEKKVEYKDLWSKELSHEEPHTSWLEDLFVEKLNNWGQGVRGTYALPSEI